MKTCNRCGVELVRGENIAPSQFDKSNFKCSLCKSEEQRAYRKTAAGRASVKRDNSGDKKTARSHRYGQSENGKVVKRRNSRNYYHASLKNDSEYKTKRKAFRQLENGKLSQKRSKSKQIESGAHAFHQRNRIAAQLQRTPAWSDMDKISEQLGDSTVEYEDTD